MVGSERRTTLTKELSRKKFFRSTGRGTGWERKDDLFRIFGTGWGARVGKRAGKWEDAGRLRRGLPGFR
jgi:hypothetical protein